MLADKVFVDLPTRETQVVSKLVPQPVILDKERSFTTSQVWKEVKGTGTVKMQKETTYNKGKNVPTKNSFNALAISEIVVDVASISNQQVEIIKQSAADLKTQKLGLVDELSNEEKLVEKELLGVNVNKAQMEGVVTAKRLDILSSKLVKSISLQAPKQVESELKLVEQPGKHLESDQGLIVKVARKEQIGNEDVLSEQIGVVKVELQIGNEDVLKKKKTELITEVVVQQKLGTGAELAEVIGPISLTQGLDSGPETANKNGEIHQIVQATAGENISAIAPSKGEKIRIEESPIITRADQQTNTIPLQSLTTNLQQIEKATNGQIAAQLLFLEADQTHQAACLHSEKCEHGELTAIAGASGAGKTTLLETLSGNIVPSRISSDILVNDQTMNVAHFPRISGYVTQDEALFPQCPPQGSRKQRENHGKVEDLLRELGLEHVSRARIGDESNRGISGGEKRRVSIGVDLVHDPDVFLIDEPTSGLDSASALHVIKMLSSMAKIQGKTILVTIHQPGFRILELINKIVLLSHLEDQLIKCSANIVPQRVNLLEIAIEFAESLDKEDRDIEMCEETKEPKDDNLEKTSFPELRVSNISDPNSPFKELSILSQRTSKNIFRTKRAFLRENSSGFTSWNSAWDGVLER
ncbi:ATP-binding cassette [Lithospermum erythrorhizon]|uniref:ATP-binding cassette n=1 Tax=Lithospermum erythrorhizon TaxID=34254 RepID=A0AAV3RGI6_LITER